MLCGFREPLRERLLEHVDEAELLTTDNHVVNVLVGGFNPIGLKDPQERIVENVEGAIEEALDNMHDAEVAAARTDIGDVLVFGSGNTIRLSSAINSAAATGKGAFPASFAFASVISAFALWLLRTGL
jgi:putative membrane protein